MIHHVRELMLEVPPWAAGLVGCLTVMFFVSQIAISYSYGSVVATLAMVESPNTTAILRTSPVDDEDADATLPPYSDAVDDKKPLLVEQEVMLITPKPITASLRGTLRHLRAETGSRLSRFRGSGVAILFGILTHFAHGVLMRIAPHHQVFRLLSFVFVQVALCRVNMLWTHMVISKPSSKRWYRRIAPRCSAKKIALPTMAFALAQVATGVVPVMVFHIVDAAKYTGKDIKDLNDSQRIALALKMFTVLASFLVTVLFVLLPIEVAFTRCQAALLPEEETPIIPFDRTFGGLVVAQSEGGTGKLRMKDAWRSFDWNARVRLAKVWAKTFGMQVGSFLFYFASTAIVVSSVTLAGKH